MRIQNNVMAFNAYRNLTVTNGDLSKNLEKLSSGFRINRAGDDAAGLVISQRLRAQVSGLKVGTRNAQDGISVVQTAEGALNETSSMLNRMRDLALQASNVGVVDTAAASAAQAEIDQLAEEITRIATTTKFGQKNLLDGSYSALVGWFQVGANANTGERIDVTISSVRAVDLGVSGLAVDSIGAASAAVAAIDTAIATVSSIRGRLGGVQNRLEATIRNLQVTTENLAASESRIRDTDMAEEMTSFTKNQILAQAGNAMLGQAQSVPQGVLRLLG